MSEHQGVLNKLIQELPSEFVWQPEKQSSVLLPLHELLDAAIEKRKNINQFSEL